MNDSYGADNDEAENDEEQENENEEENQLDSISIIFVKKRPLRGNNFLVIRWENALLPGVKYIIVKHLDAFLYLSW